MHPVQIECIAARVLYELAKEAADQVDREYEAAYALAVAGMSEEEVEAYDAAERANAQPHPVLVAQTEALKELRAAERKLLDWCAASVGRLAVTQPQREAVELCRTCPPWLPQYAKVVDLALRLDSRTV